MSKPLIIVSSITYAMKGKDILLENRIKSYVEKIPNLKKGSGCGYVLYVPERIDEAYNILLEHGIKLNGKMNWDGEI